METVTFPSRVCKVLGVEAMFGLYLCLRVETASKITSVTNAAGGLNEEYTVGDIILLNDVRKLVLQVRHKGLTGS